MSKPIDRSAHQLRVERFMQLAGQELPPSPKIPSLDVRILRAKLILEEALETIQKGLGLTVKASGGNVVPKEGLPIRINNLLIEENKHKKPDIVEIADGCCDLMVVTTGTLSACGIKDKPILKAVDHSNLAKFTEPKCPTCNAPMVINGDYCYCSAKGCSNFDDISLSKFGGYRREDGKWIKPKDWQAPPILELLTEQGYCGSRVSPE